LATPSYLSNVLPGFQFRVTDLQRQPSLAEMSKDGVYQGFVGLDRQAERQARQLAEAQVQAERAARQVAEAKLQQLEAELARLRQLR